MKITLIFLVIVLFIFHCKRESTDSINDNSEPFWIKTSAPDSIYYRDIIILDSGTILVLSNEDQIYRSTDHGSTWELIELSYYYALTLELFNKNKALVGTSEGIIISEDEGATWNKFGLDSLIIREIASTHYDNRNILVAGSHEKVFKSSDGGLSWNELGCPDGIVTSVGLKNDEVIIVGKFEADEGVLWVTQDGGTTWDAPLFHCMAQTIFFNSQKNIYVGATHGIWINGGLYYSENDGTDWIRILPDSVAVVSGLLINDNEIYVIGNGVIKVLDEFHWITINNGIPSRDLTDIVLGIHGHLYVVTRFNGIYKSKSAVI